MTSTRKIHIAAFAALTAITIGCGGPDRDDVTVSGGTVSTSSADDDGDAPTATTAKVGQQLKVNRRGDSSAWTLIEVEHDKRDDLAAATSGQYLSLHVKAEATGGEVTYVNPWQDLALVTADGKVLEQTLATFAKRTPMPTTDIRAGERAQGWVFYDLTAADAKGAKLRLTQFNLFGDDPVGYWQL